MAMKKNTTSCRVQAILQAKGMAGRQHDVTQQCGGLSPLDMLQTWTVAAKEAMFIHSLAGVHHTDFTQAETLTNCSPVVDEVLHAQEDAPSNADRLHNN